MVEVRLPTTIGSVVRSNSHISYLCRVYGKLETEVVPSPDEHSFGTFIRFEPLEGSTVQLVGVVGDTVLLNPEFGNLGPRLSRDAELSVFSPDYLNERGVLVDVIVLGWLENGQPHHGVPAPAPQIGTRVETMSPQDVQAFHRDDQGKFFAGYLPALMMRNDPMMNSLLLTLLDRLQGSFPAHAKVIAVLKNNLAWKARVVPAG